MREGLHPAYGPVAFRDRSTGKVLVTRSTLVGRTGTPTVEIDGRELPLIDVDVSSDSHPFWTGRSVNLDSEGRVQAFERRYGRRS